MYLTDNDNFKLGELRELVAIGNNNGAIDYRYGDRFYTFLAENDHVIVQLNTENIGYIWFESIDDVKFENWNDNTNYYLIWFDELDDKIYGF